MKLIYIMDPQCGWCFGFAPQISKFDVSVRFGGMWLSPQAPIGGPSLADFIKNNGPRMEQITGRKLGKAYYELCLNSNYEFSSLPPCAACLLVKKRHPDQLKNFVALLQDKFFIEGKRMDKEEVYKEIMDELGFSREDQHYVFSNWMSYENIEETHKEFEYSRYLTAGGYPTVLAQKDGKIYTLSQGFTTQENLEKAIQGLR